MTEATPMMMPNIVRKLRILFARNDRNAIQRLSSSIVAGRTGQGRPRLPAPWPA